MIYGSCYTNLDYAKKWTWPTKFVVVPRIGDRVMAKETGHSTILKVYSISHCMATDPERNDGGLRPEIRVELNR